MRFDGRSGLFLLVVIVVTSARSLYEEDVQFVNSDPYSAILSDPNFRPKPEKDPGNKTIDQLIESAYGGFGMYMSESFLDLSGDITAEMDMVLSSEQYQAMFMKESREGGRQKRKATRPLIYRWPDATIPYEFVTPHFNADEVYYIKKAMDRWQETTCLTFRPYDSRTDKNRIRFQNGNGCNSQLGNRGYRGVQAINLQSPGCRYSGLYLHEIGHAIGLVHEHQLPDRDQYIYIIYDNVAPSMRQWFNKYSSEEVNQYGVPYEYSSVMHYGVQAFSKDGSAQTIKARDPSREAEIGRVYLKGLSFTDIKVVNLMYECNKHCASDSSCQDPAYLNKDCQCVRPDDVTTTKPTTGGCSNVWDEGLCQGWAERGECTRNPLWMKDNCKKACDACDNTGGGGGGEEPDEKECTNIWGDYKCTPWAQGGECEKNPEWMRQNCRKACQACSAPTCVDKTNPDHCRAWAQSGYCETNWYTRDNCPKSCGTCGSGGGQTLKGERDSDDADDTEEDADSKSSGSNSNSSSSSSSGSSSNVCSGLQILLFLVTLVWLQP